MSGIVILKWGGGLITYKEKICEANYEIIDSLANTCFKSRKRLVVVHGAGSFGHLKSKEFRLSEGNIDGFEQENGVRQVREDMLLLNSIVVSSLEKYGLSVKSFPPHTWAKGTGPNFAGDLPFHEGITVVYGDVVDDDEQEFGILSGDDLMVRYAVESENVERVIFAMGGVDGILRVPPDRAKDDDLIEEWSQNMQFEGEHESDIDVTGGIGLKASRASMIANTGKEVLFINGEISERVFSAIMGKRVIGTRIVSGNS